MDEHGGLPARGRRVWSQPALADLLPPHRVVQPFLRDELVVAPGFHHPAPLKDVDPVRVQDGREPVGNENGDRVAAGGHVTNRLDHALFGERVEGGGGLVKDQ